jgi:tetratricopeptide (TPR) repeat protein
MQTRESRESSVPLKYLPWIAIGAIGVVYLLTLNHWLSRENLPLISRLNGWEWYPLSSPALPLLVAKPVGLLPLGAQPLALSVVSFVCAILNLVLLVRTVTLLPQERTRAQRQRVLQSGGILPPGVAWLPATLAVLVCGLQFTFWENATTTSTEIVLLLPLAYAVRNLAEFRVDGRDSWLFKAGLVFGIGVANNFAMVAYLPLFLLVVAWLKGKGTFDFQFLLRFGLLLAAGLLAYLIVPAAHLLSDASPTGFWGALRAYLGGQKYAVVNYQRIVVLLLSMVSIIPLLGMAFRWGESGGDVSAASAKVTTFAIHVVSLAFLVLGLAVPFEYHDGQFSLRKLGITAGTPALQSVFYLSAISLGYYAGYLFNVFGTPSIHKWDRPTPTDRLVGRVLSGTLMLLLVAAPALLIRGSWMDLRKAHGPELEQLARRLAEQVPPGAITISDSDLFRLATQAGMALARRSDSALNIGSGALTSPAFHRHMRKAHPGRWPELPAALVGDGNIRPVVVNHVLTSLCLSNQVLYTEPSFGYFFEAHYLEPVSLVSFLRPMPVSMLDIPNPGSNAVAKAVAYWRQLAATDFPGLIAQVPSKPGMPVQNLDATLTRLAYSRMLNFWGVSVERAGYLGPAAEFFDLALKLNPQNPNAYLNLRYNQQIRTNGSIFVIPDQTLTNMFRAASQGGGGIEAVLRDHGPVDETGNLLYTSQLFAQAQDYVQAAQMLRIIGSRTNNPSEYLIASAKLLNQGRRPDLALRLVDQLRQQAPANFARNAASSLELLGIEAESLYYTGNFPKATALLTDAMRRYPGEDAPYSTLVGLHVQEASQALQRGRTNDFNSQLVAAQDLLRKQLALQPTNAVAWVNAGAIEMQLGRYKEAIVPLTRALTFQKDNRTALLNRAICHLKVDHLKEAEEDYQHLFSLYTSTPPYSDPPYPVLYGLGEVNLRNNRKKEALRNFKSYLEHAPQSAEADAVREKIKSLR